MPGVYIERIEYEITVTKISGDWCSVLLTRRRQLQSWQRQSLLAGFFVLAGLLTVVSALMCLFPKNLRKPAVDKQAEEQPGDNDVMMKKMDTMMGSMDELHTGVRPAEKLQETDGELGRDPQHRRLTSVRMLGCLRFYAPE